MMCLLYVTYVQYRVCAFIHSHHEVLQHMCVLVMVSQHECVLMWSIAARACAGYGFAAAQGCAIMVNYSSSVC